MALCGLASATASRGCLKRNREEIFAFPAARPGSNFYFLAQNQLTTSSMQKGRDGKHAATAAAALPLLFKLKMEYFF